MMARLDQRDGLSVTVVSNALRLRRFTPPTLGVEPRRAPIATPALP